MSVDRATEREVGLIKKGEMDQKLFGPNCPHSVRLAVVQSVPIEGTELKPQCRRPQYTIKGRSAILLANFFKSLFGDI